MLWVFTDLFLIFLFICRVRERQKVSKKASGWSQQLRDQRNKKRGEYWRNFFQEKVVISPSIADLKSFLFSPVFNLTFNFKIAGKN